MATLRIAGGRVVDPANGVNDEVRDLWIDGGQVIAAPADLAAKARPDHRCAGLRGDARRRGRAFAHRRFQGQRRAGAAARGAEEPRCGLAASRGIPVGDRGQRAQHVRHGLPVRRAGLHDRGRCGDPSAGSPAGPCRVSGHAPAGQADARADGKSPRDPGPGGQGRSGTAAPDGGMAAGLAQRATGSRSSIRAAWSSGSRAERGWPPGTIASIASA